MTDGPLQALQEAMSAARRDWDSKPPAARGPEPVSGDFRVTAGELGLADEDQAYDFRRFMQDTARKAGAGDRTPARDHPAVALIQAIADSLRTSGEVKVKRPGMTWAEMQVVTGVLRAAVDTAAGRTLDSSPRHVQIAARELAEAWEAFSGTTADPRTPGERTLAWGDERGWLYT